VAESESPKAALGLLGLAPKRHFGQNFLADRGLCERIAELCAPAGSTVLELGAGLGALTTPLLARAERVIAVERDRDLVPVLAQKFADAIEAGKLELLEADAKALDVSALLGGAPRPRVLCGNLPYQITGPLIELAVGASRVVDRAVFLVQLEVAARLAAATDSDAYGALSVFTQAAYDVKRALVVRRGAFYPQPSVDSAVVLLSPRAELIVETASFREFVRAAFAQRRKKLKSAWKGARGLGPEALLRAAERAAIDLERRGETLSVDDFQRMAVAADAELS
jgi:16S rRNA (adenine1518-N6/adenine1519-N6)-dimethyltransferase